MRGATFAATSAAWSSEFQPTLPLRGTTSRPDKRNLADAGFNPRSPCGERRQTSSECAYLPCFNPRSPCGERHPRRVACRTRRARFNPRSPCGERRRTRRWPCARPRCFNPRSPCGERRTNTAQVDSHSQLQPTLPLRGATYQGLSYSEICAFQPTLPLRGATCPSRQPPNRPPSVSTHAPLAGSDEHGESVVTYVAQFQPTLPLRGATSEAVCDFGDLFSFNPRSPCGERREQAGIEARTRSVSTHAPLAGSDGSRSDRRTRHPRFNPRSPCGERRERAPVHLELVGVSTHAPLAGSDQVESRELHGHRVSTHAPLAGSDQTSYSVAASSDKFQPTLPLRGAT